MTIAIIVMAIALAFSVTISIGLWREIRKYQEIKRQIIQEQIYRKQVRTWMKKTLDK